MFLKSLSHRLSETHKVIRVIDPRPVRTQAPPTANAPRKRVVRPGV